MQQLRAKLQDLKGKVTKNLKDNIHDQYDNSTFHYNWSGLDLSGLQKKQLKSNLYKLWKLFVLPNSTYVVDIGLVRHYTAGQTCQFYKNEVFRIVSPVTCISKRFYLHKIDLTFLV